MSRCLSSARASSASHQHLEPNQNKPITFWTTAFVCAGAPKDSDTQTMNSIYTHLGSPDQLASWAASSGSTACNMTGIACNSQAKVVSLSLYNIPIGTLDPLLFTLTSLSSIILINLGLVGLFPAQISQLTSLQTLKMSNNHLTGSLPPSLSLLVLLTALEIDSNQITGSIPPQLSTLVLLCQLQLGHNNLDGSLPASLSTLTGLAHFYAPSNLLSGSIPAEYSALQKLTMLSLASNTLSSSIPSQLTNIGFLSLLVNGNPAMCGPTQGYGKQQKTNISKDCPLQGMWKCQRTECKGNLVLYNCSIWGNYVLPHVFPIKRIS